MKSPIEQLGSTVLRDIAKPIAKKDIGSLHLKRIIEKMRKTLAPEENGVAIAAPQIGESLRMFLVAGKVFDSEPEHFQKSPLLFINPEIIRTSRKKKHMSEGCLSVRDVFGSVVRFEKVSIKALNEEGKLMTYHGSGLLGQIFQHEIDHLDGILFIDKAEKIDDPELLSQKMSERKKTKAS